MKLTNDNLKGINHFQDRSITRSIIKVTFIVFNDSMSTVAQQHNFLDDYSIKRREYKMIKRTKPRSRRPHERRWNRGRTLGLLGK